MARPSSQQPDTGAARQSSGFEAAAIGIFLGPDGRLPGFAQRRLDDLIEKKKRTRLTAKERRELDEALDYIDRKSIQLLEYAAATKNGKGAKEPSPHPPGAPAGREPSVRTRTPRKSSR